MANSQPSLWRSIFYEAPILGAMSRSGLKLLDQLCPDVDKQESSSNIFIRLLSLFTARTIKWNERWVQNDRLPAIRRRD